MTAESAFAGIGNRVSGDIDTAGCRRSRLTLCPGPTNRPGLVGSLLKNPGVEAPIRKLPSPEG